MAALESTRFVRFALPPSNPPFCNSNTFWPAKTSRSIPSLTSSQKARRPAATLSRSGCQAEAERNTAARAEGGEPAPANSDDEIDDDLPFLEELFRTPVPPSNTSTKASKAEHTLRHLEQPAPDATGTLIDETKSGLGERQGDSPDQPVILDDNESDEADTGDEAEGASVDIETGCLERDPSPYNISATSEPALGPIKSIDTSGPWYDVEEGCYIDEPAPRLGSCEQQDMPSAPAQDQHQTLFQSFHPLRDQISQQDVGSITRSMSVESAPHSPLHFPNGDDSMAELEKELELAFLEQVKLLSASTLSSPRPLSVEAPPDESQSREHTEITSIRSEELQDASRHGTPAPGLEEWEKRETEVVVEGGGVAMQQQQEFAAQKEELGQPAVGEGDQPDLVEVVDADDPKDKEATETLPVTQPEIPEVDEHRFRLRGIRTRQFAERQTKTTQYRVVWGKHPNRSDSWVNEDDIRVLMLWPLGEQDLIPQIETSVRVHQMRCNRRSKSRKFFEYLVDGLSTWITEDQLRISLSSTSLVELKASSPHPLSQTQSEVHPRHSATPINDEHRHTSPASRSSSPSAPSNPAPGGEPELGRRGKKRWRQDTHTEVSSKTHHPVNAEDTCDTGDEDPRPAKRRKPRSTPAVTAFLHPRWSPPLVLSSTTSLEIDDAQPQADHECVSTFVDDEQHRTSRASPSPSTATEAVPFTEYQEWPFQGFLKRAKIGDDVTYNLEFKLPSISEHCHLPINHAALDISSSKEAPAKVPIHHDAATHSKIHQAPLQPKKRRVKWTTEEDATLLQMRNDGCSWEDISAALPHRSIGTIRVRCSTKFKK